MVADQIGRAPAAREKGDAASRRAQRCKQAIGRVARSEAVDHGTHANAALRGDQQSIEHGPACSVALEDIHDDVDAVRSTVYQVKQPGQSGAAIEDQLDTVTGDVRRQSFG